MVPLVAEHRDGAYMLPYSEWSCVPSGLGVREEWPRFVYKHRDDVAQRKLQGSIVKIATGSWHVETIEKVTAAQAAFTLTMVRASPEIPSQRLAHMAVMCCVPIGPSHRVSSLLCAASVRHCLLLLPAASAWRAQHKPSKSPQTMSWSSGCILSRFVPRPAIQRMVLIAAQLYALSRMSLLRCPLSSRMIGACRRSSGLACVRKVQHALRHGVDTKLSTDGDGCADGRDAYQRYVHEVGTWARLPGGAVTLKAAAPLEAGARSKAPGKRKAAEEDSDSDGEPDDDEQPQDE